mgnify:CR=1 FL=1
MPIPPVLGLLARILSASRRIREDRGDPREDDRARRAAEEEEELDDIEEEEEGW